MIPFKEFNTRYKSNTDFYACINKEGFWFDSSESFAAAVHWCASDAGIFVMNNLEEIIWMDTQTEYSIVHSSMLKKMYDAGLIS